MDNAEGKNFSDVLVGLKSVGKIQDYALFGGIYQIKHANGNLTYVNTNNSLSGALKVLTNGINVNLGIKK